MSIIGCIRASFIIFALSRAAYFGMMTSIWAALPIEAVAGFVFSLYWPSSAKIFDEMAPEGTKNTVQGLGAFNFALGMSNPSPIIQFFV